MSSKTDQIKLAMSRNEGIALFQGKINPLYSLSGNVLHYSGARANVESALGSNPLANMQSKEVIEACAEYYNNTIDNQVIQMIFGAISELKSCEADQTLVIKDIESALKEYCLKHSDAFMQAIIQRKRAEKEN